ncbi:MAG TPA: anthranilate synthase component I [Halobacteria archaeon]|nr:anthranilate synthase component I [Halobacteria archaeon]
MNVKIKEIEYIDPLRLFSSIKKTKYPFILESLGKTDRKARFTFLGCNPSAIINVSNNGTKIEVFRDIKGINLDSGEIKEKNPFSALDLSCKLYKDFVSDIKNPFGEKAFLGGLLGVFKYDSVFPSLLNRNVDGMDRIDGRYATFGFYDNVFVYDNRNKKLFLSSINGGQDEQLSYSTIIQRLDEEIVHFRDYTECSGANNRILNVETDADKDDYLNMVARSKEYVEDGDVIQVVVSREEDITGYFDPYNLYLSLRQINPSPYMFYFDYGDILFGASPETMASIFNRRLTINPIAGTTDRGKNEKEDQILAKNMMEDEKELSEHNMLLDLARNDIRRVSKSGSIKIEGYLNVLQYSHVQHLESVVSGELRDDVSEFKAIESAFPAGTLSGAPKIRAIEIIDELEKSRRDSYGGGIGYFSMDGSADFAIVIRSAIAKRLNDTFRIKIRAGAGIVADSIPENEFLETERKLKAVKSVLGV